VDPRTVNYQEKSKVGDGGRSVIKLTEYTQEGKRGSGRVDNQLPRPAVVDMDDRVNCKPVSLAYSVYCEMMCRQAR
jgi:hypothetical protein